jgi:radical SAM protein with 4Fe4S-binding SPASM domain
MEGVNYTEIDKFKVIQMEIYHGCNLNCKTCPRSVIPANGELMSEEIYFKILNDLKEANFRGRISPYDMGEPTLDKRLPMLIEKTREMFPDNVIMIGSNGVAIDQDYIQNLLDKGLSQILITCYTEHTYEKFKDMEDGITVRLWKVFEHDLNKIFMNRGGNVKFGPEVLVHKTCEKGIKQAMVNYLGDVIFCCSDYGYKFIAGNVLEENLYILWNKPKYKEARYYLARSERDKIELCSKCNFLHD